MICKELLLTRSSKPVSKATLLQLWRYRNLHAAWSRSGCQRGGPREADLAGRILFRLVEPQVFRSCLGSRICRFPEMMAVKKTREASSNTAAHVCRSNFGEKSLAGEGHLEER